MSAPRHLYRKPARHRKPPERRRKPSKITLAVAGVAAVATLAVASGVAVAAPDGPASPAAPSRPAAGTAAVAGDVTRQLELVKIHLGAVERHRLAAAARRAAARRERRCRRPACRRARGGPAGAAVRWEFGQLRRAPGSPQQIAAAMLGSFGWSSGELAACRACGTPRVAGILGHQPDFGCLWHPAGVGSKMASAGPDWQTNPASQIVGPRLHPAGLWLPAPLVARAEHRLVLTGLGGAASGLPRRGGPAGRQPSAGSAGGTAYRPGLNVRAASAKAAIVCGQDADGAAAMSS